MWFKWLKSKKPNLNNDMKNNKIGQNDVNDSSVNKKSKNSNYNTININNYQSASEIGKFADDLSNLKIIQAETMDIIRNCKNCINLNKPLFAEKLQKIKNLQEENEKSEIKNMVKIIYDNSRTINKVENEINSMLYYGTNIETCNLHIKIKIELRRLYIRINDLENIKENLFKQ